ncbi:MAG: hypothetical protein J7497_10085, partial [Chitinophagaceae bacterium]|nr:hypothetical protein [Chitinophagaceae bacterium]
MIQSLSLATGEPLSLEPYNSGAHGAIEIPGDEVYYAEGSFGTLITILQTSGNLIFMHNYINWKKGDIGLTITYKYDQKVLSIRAITQTHFNETLKCGGKSILEPGQFNCVAGQSWTTTITVGEP